MKSVDEQLALIRRGLDQIEREDELRKKLERSVKTGKPLRIKYGIDPTAPDVHLGHTVPLRKMRLFQELGHQAVLIIGNYTAMVGDPSGRDETRARLTHEKIEENAAHYLRQISKIIDINKTEVTRNGDWFGKFTFIEVMQLTARITVQRMLERDDFTKRIKEGKPISLHECLYPLMQGHDSVVIKADVELGGSEQLFNLMVGRDLQRQDGQEPQVCLTLPILRGLDGVRRMGKSLGNYIGVGEPAFEMFAKVMQIPDHLMPEWFRLLTDRQESEAQERITANPMDAKKLLGRDIVGFYYGADGAEQAQKDWESRVSKGQDPDMIEEKVIPASELTDGKIGVCKLLALLGFVKSNGEARRLVEGGGVNIGPDREKIADFKAMLALGDGLIIRAGKKSIARVRAG